MGSQTPGFDSNALENAIQVRISGSLHVGCILSAKCKMPKGERNSPIQNTHTCLHARGCGGPGSLKGHLRAQELVLLSPPCWACVGSRKARFKWQRLGRLGPRSKENLPVRGGALP